MRCINLTLWEDEAYIFTRSPTWYLAMQENNGLSAPWQMSERPHRHYMIDAALR